MSYKYKDEILEDIGPEPNANYYIESERYYQKLEELDEVYRKAEAFDAILKAYDEAFAIEHMAGEVSNIIEKYESSE